MNATISFRLAPPAALVALGLLLGPALAACSDDDVTQVCGNGLVEGTEQCDGAELGGSTCTSIPGGFVGGDLACDSGCTFDTSGCHSTQPTCPNGTIDPAEDCDGANLGGMTCLDVGNYTGGTLACAGDCTWDESGCEAPAGCGNGVIDSTEDCDGANLGGMTCPDVGNYTGGTLACAGDCTWDESGCDYQLSPSEQIAAVRAIPDATGYSLDVEHVTVTYLKPALGNDPAGFTVQADQAGPAIFLRLDPTSLAPSPAPGDDVSFTVVEVTTSQGRREVLTVTGWTLHSSGAPLAPLTQTVTDATDLVSGLSDYEVELITVDATILGDFSSGGAGHLKASIDTDGVAGDPDLQLRLPSGLVATLGLEAGCTVTVTQTPLWRYQSQAQVIAYDPAEVAVSSCPAPQVLGASSTDATTVVIVMSRPVDAASITDPATQVTFTGGLSATDATVSANEITVTTTAQAPGSAYTVTLAGTITDTQGAGVDPAANSAAFLGFGGASSELLCADGADDDGDGFTDCLDIDCATDSACAWESKLYLWELDADQPSTDSTEYVELWNNTGAPIDFATERYFLLFVNGNGEVVYGGAQLTGVLGAGDVYVVGSAAVPNVDLVITPSTNLIQNGPDGLLLLSCNTCGDMASAFPSGYLVTFDPGPPNYVSADGAPAMWVDALAYDTNDSDDPGLMSALDVLAQINEGGGAGSAIHSLQRISPQGWTTALPSPGVSSLQ